MSGTVGAVTTVPSQVRRLKVHERLQFVSEPSLAARLFRPGWPLTAMFVGYPLWWILGAAEYISLVLTGVMAVQLIRQRHIGVPRGFGTWLLFLAWVVGGVFTLQVDAPGTVPGGSGTRYLTFAYRLLWYLGGTVVLLYIGNHRRDLSSRRIARILSVMFLVITAGGLLGSFFPSLQLRSVLELVLPASVSKVGFVYNTIHPTLAQVQSFLGYAAARPSAPYAYTNDWGLNFALFLPFFVRGWCGRDAGWRRAVAPLVLVSATIPVIHSLNRGLWIALLAMGAFVALRAAVTGRVAALGGLVAAVGVIVLLLFATPLGGLVSDRLAHPNSNKGRTNLGTLSVTSVARGAPIIGFGSTRNVQGNFSSIAGGKTANCPLCSPPPTGTQGQLFLVVFSEGIVGLVLFLGFFALQFLRYIRVRSPDITLGCSVLIGYFVTLVVYSTSPTALVAVMAAVALMWRAGTPGDMVLQPPWRATTATLRSFVTLPRRHPKVIIPCLIIGALLGGAWQLHRGTPASASVSLLVPAGPSNPDIAASPLTMDTAGQLVSSASVVDAIERATGLSEAEASKAISVSAVPNSRILSVTITTRDAKESSRAARAAAEAYLVMRTSSLQAQRSAQIHVLQVRSRALGYAYSTAIRWLAAAGATQRELGSLRDEASILQDQDIQVEKLLSQLTSAPLQVGAIVQPVQVSRSHGGWYVSLASGLLLGLLGGVTIAWLRDVRSMRIRRSVEVRALTGLDVLAVVPRPSGLTPESMIRAPSDIEHAIRLHRPDTFVNVSPNSDASRAVASRLDRVLADGREGDSSNGHRPMLVAAVGRTRLAELNRAARALERNGLSPAGVVLVDGPHRG